MQKKQIAALLIIALVIAVWFALDLGQYLQFDVLQQRIGELRAWYAENPLRAGVIYFFLYILVTALSVPGGPVVMTLAGGALFGFWYAVLLVSFASSIGATLAFLVSRLLLRDWAQGRFARQLQSVNRGFEKDGNFYLFSLRLVPLFPFLMVNLLMGLLPIRVASYYLVSQLGMLPGTAIYVNAGTQLGQLDSSAGILSPAILLSFGLLALFPFIARKMLAVVKLRHQFAAYAKPKRFDNNLIVIGAGSAGLVAALIAATVRARVTLVERHKMGGDCLNTGCVPSKTLIRSARIAEYARRAEEFGLAPMDVQVRFPKVMQRVRAAIETIEPHDSVERFTGLGVNCVQGDAIIRSPWEVEVNGEVLTARHIVIASGARPRVPDIEGLQTIDFLTSDNVWDLQELPRRLLVVGGGPIGCELAQAFSRLGSEVTVVTRASRILPREDHDASDHVLDRFRQEGMQVLTGHAVQAFSATEAGTQCTLSSPAGESIIACDRVLLAVGRSANVETLGLEALGIGLAPEGTLEVDEYLATAVPTISACGDVAGPYLFTHMASHQAWYATVNGLFGGWRRFRVDYSVVPWATFTDPEVARVGLNELDAQAQGIAYDVTRYDLSGLDRAVADGEACGFVKVLTVPGRDTILGATIVGYHAAELIGEFVLAMKHGIGLGKLLGTIHIYPTLGEANKFAASEWRKARKPERLLQWVGTISSLVAKLIEARLSRD